MSDDCPRRPELQARLMALRSAIHSASARIERELEEPTMSRLQLIRSTQALLDMAVESEG